LYSVIRHLSSGMFPWLLILAALWAPLIYLLGAQWSVYQQYNYGWAVPLLCLYLAWQRMRAARSEVRGQTPVGGGRWAVGGEGWSVVRGPWSVVLLLFGGGLLYAATRVLQEANPIWRAASWALALEAAAITLLLLHLGLRTSNSQLRASTFAFPVAFFLVAVPWPTPVEGAVIQSLTRLNAAVVVELLNALGIPALARGNVIEVSKGLVGIDEACSGIRSVQATLMISLFFGELCRLAVFRRTALCALGFGLALLFNLARMFLMTWVAARDGTQAIAKWHDPAGVTILVACFVCLWLAAMAFARSAKREAGRLKMEDRRQGAGSREQGEVKSGNAEKLKAESRNGTMGPQDYRTTGLVASEVKGGNAEKQKAEIRDQRTEGGRQNPNSELRTPNSEFQNAPSTLNSQHSTFNFQLRRPWPLACAVVLWVVLVEVGTEVWFRSHEARDGRTVSWSIRWPETNATFALKPLPGTVSEMLKYDEGQSGAWVESDGSAWQAFYLRWLPAKSFYGRMRVALSKSHNPEVCLQAGGLRLRTELAPVVVQARPDFSLVFRRYVFDAEGRTLHVFFSATEDLAGAGTPSFLRMTHLERVRAALAGSRNFGQRNVEVAISGFESPADALRVFEERLPGLLEVGDGGQ
jgi:exosortase